ncbi:MAG: hypothetical protein HFE75_04150 [Firmicutes bacterium]|nr:hypothetical protein [Bacillota bacterium]
MDQRVYRRQSLEEGRQDGLRQGLEQGIEQGVRSLIKTCKEFNIPRDALKVKLLEEFKLEDTKAENYLKQYWI